MLKEVGTSGQISLGKKYAGQLFDLQTTADGHIVLRPVQVVPVAPLVQEAQATYQLSQSTQQSNHAWAQAHAGDIDQYNAWASQNEPYAQRVRRWRDENLAQGANTTQAFRTLSTEPSHGPV